MNNGTTIKLAKKGSCNEDLVYGDLIIKVTVKPNNKFKREGNDVISNLTLSLADVIFM